MGSPDNPLGTPAEQFAIAQARYQKAASQPQDFATSPQTPHIIAGLSYSSALLGFEHLQNNRLIEAANQCALNYKLLLHHPTDPAPFKTLASTLGKVIPNQSLFWKSLTPANFPDAPQNTQYSATDPRYGLQAWINEMAQTSTSSVRVRSLSETFPTPNKPTPPEPFSQSQTVTPSPHPTGPTPKERAIAAAYAEAAQKEERLHRSRNRGIEGPSR